MDDVAHPFVQRNAELRGHFRREAYPPVLVCAAAHGLRNPSQRRLAQQMLVPRPREPSVPHAVEADQVQARAWAPTQPAVA